jgi:putative peptide zinc metalloprotease protein
VIREDRPVLTPGSKVVRQVEEGVTRWVVRAGPTGKYLRVGEPESVLLGLMDGTRTVDGVRRSYVARAKEAIETADVAAFVARMRKEAVVEETAEARSLLLVEKARQRRKERMFAGKVGSLFFLRWKMIDPDAWLTRIERRVRWIFTKPFLVFAALLVLAAVAILVHRFDEVAGRVRNFLLIGAGSGVSLPGMWLTALCLVALHETGHGVACKHWGGEVHEMGFLLLFFNPCMYCNVNDAWTFESRAQRLWVTAAGSFVEVVIGSACVIVWAATEPGSAVHGIAYLVFMISLSGTLLFNMNPLIKLDGYYLLADFLRIENLRDRSVAQISWLFRTRVLRRPAAKPTEDRREAWILGLYGVASSIYQALLAATLLGIVLAFLAGEAGVSFLTVAMLGSLAVLILLRPLRAAKEVVMQATQAAVRKHGVGGTLLRVGAVLAAAGGLSLVVPWTVTAAAPATAEPVRVVAVRSPLAGTVAEVLVEDGARVAEGDPLFRVEAPVEEASARVERERATRARREVLRHRAGGDFAGAESLEESAEAAEMRAADAEARLARARVASPLAGVVLDRRVREAEGAPVAREAPVLRVGDLTRMRFRALLDARQVGPLRTGMEAALRLRAFPGETLVGRIVAVSRTPVDAKDPRVAEAAGPRWEVVVEADNPGGRIRPGMTAELSVVLEETTVAGALARGVRGTVRTDLLR